MGTKLYHVLLWLSLLWSSSISNQDQELELEGELLAGDHWERREARPEAQAQLSCARVKPSSRDIIKRFYAILPYFDKDHANPLFLRRYRATINVMTEDDDPLDKEAAFHAAVLTPVIFLQQYRDTWCLLERFQRAIRLYQISHPAEKRSALKILQQLRDVYSKVHGLLKVRTVVNNLPGPSPPTRSTTLQDLDDEELRDKKDIRYLKELIKNLG